MVQIFTPSLVNVPVQWAVILSVENPVTISVLVTVVSLTIAVAVLLAGVGLPHAVVPGARLHVAVQLNVGPPVSVPILTNGRPVLRSRDQCTANQRRVLPGHSECLAPPTLGHRHTPHTGTGQTPCNARIDEQASKQIFSALIKITQFALYQRELSFDYSRFIRKDVIKNPTPHNISSVN